MAGSPLESQIIQLKDTIAALNKTVESLQKSLDASAAREEEHLKTEQNLKEQVAYLMEKLYGSSSEKRKSVMEGQISLFDEAEVEAEPLDDVAFEEETVTFTRKKKATQKEKFSNLPVTKKYIDIPEEERFCDRCGSGLDYVGEDFVRRELVFVPAKVQIVEYFRKSYECRNCKKETGIPKITKAGEGTYRMIHGMASASTVAWIIYQKYCNSLPLARQEKEWKLYGCDISRATMANWVIKNSEEFFRPMCDFFKSHILSRNQAMADETPVQVLHEKDRSPQTKSYMWVFRTGEFLDKPAIVYHYEPTRSGHVASKFFDGYDGYLMCDGFSGYNAVSDVKRTGCWAHARRYLLDAVPKKDRSDYSVPAVQGAMYIDKLFEIERKIHKKERSADEIKELRLRDEKPVLRGLWSWLEKQSATKGSKFHKALTYLSNQRVYLERYLEDGLCSFSNNASERCCKAFVVGRKNWLFSNSAKGADASAYAYSIIQTAIANDVNPYHYLWFLLDKAPSSQMSMKELEELAPWNEKVQQELLHREIEAMK